MKNITVGTASSKASLDTNFRNTHDNFVELFNRVADDLAVLRGIPSASGVVYMKGRATTGDGGQGAFVWDSSDLSVQVTADTLGGIYVAPDSDPTGSSGAWVRLLANEIYPDWYAVNTVPGTTDMYAAIIAALSAAGSKKTVTFLPGVVYASSTEIQGKLPEKFIGPKINGNFATIKSLNAMASVLTVGTTTTRQVNIKNLILDANSLATYGFKGVMITEQDSLIENLTAINAVSHGIYCDGCQVSTFRNIKSSNNGGDGYLFESCNGLSLETPRATANAANGITIQRGSRAFTGGMQMHNPDIEQNLGHGIRVVDTLSPVTISGGWLESNAMDGINISAVGVSVKNVGIIGGDAGNTYRAVRLAEGAKGCEVSGNKLAYSLGTGAFAKVRNESTGLNNTINPNYTRSSGGVVRGEYAVASQSNPLVITGVTSIDNIPKTLFNFAGTIEQGVHIKLVITGNCVGFTYYTVSVGITIVANGTATYAAQDTLVQANNGSSVLPVFTLSGSGTSMAIQFNHRSATASDATWVAEIIGKFTPTLIIIP